MNVFEPYELQFDEAARKKMIAESLEKLRKKNGYTQKQVAEYLGINPVTYHGYEKGKNEPGAENLVRLAYLFHVSTDTILQKDRLELDEEAIARKLREYKKMLDEYKEKAAQNGQNEQFLPFIDKMGELAEILQDLQEKTKNSDT